MEETAYVGGPLDGMVKMVHRLVRSTMFVHGGVYHRYVAEMIDGKPERNEKGQRVMSHCQAKAYEKH